MDTFIKEIYWCDWAEIVFNKVMYTSSYRSEAAILEMKMLDFSLCFCANFASIGDIFVSAMLMICPVFPSNVIVVVFAAPVGVEASKMGDWHRKLCANEVSLLVKKRFGPCMDGNV